MARIAANRSLVDEFGAAGRRFAETFTWDRAADETLAHLAEIVARPA
jgi:glycosyltransferase involved in cell wall biosynthesis